MALSTRCRLEIAALQSDTGTATDKIDVRVLTKGLVCLKADARLLNCLGGKALKISRNSSHTWINNANTKESQPPFGV